MRILHVARLWGEALFAQRMPSVYHGILKLWGRSNSIKVLLAGLVRRGDVVFDVGANRGILTSLMSNLVGPDGRVHAFEPSSDTCRLLRVTLVERARHPANVVVNASAVGTEDGAATLYTPQQDHGQASLRTHEMGSWSAHASVRSDEVAVTRLDSYLAAQAQSRIDLVKMDVEGAELPALHGFAAGLRSFHPIIVCELCGAWTRAFGYEPSAVIEELKSAGYDSFHLVTDRGGLRALTSSHLVNDGESHDLVASVEGAHASRVRRLVR
jgi:FkbM family methyltransferase